MFLWMIVWDGVLQKMMSLWNYYRRWQPSWTCYRGWCPPRSRDNVFMNDGRNRVLHDHVVWYPSWENVFRNDGRGRCLNASVVIDIIITVDIVVVVVEVVVVLIVVIGIVGIVRRTRWLAHGPWFTPNLSPGWRMDNGIVSRQPPTLHPSDEILGTKNYFGKAPSLFYLSWSFFVLCLYVCLCLCAFMRLCVLCRVWERMYVCRWRYIRCNNINIINKNHHHHYHHYHY